MQQAISASGIWAGKDGAKRDELLGDLLAWFDSVDALLPEEANPKYDEIAHRKADQKTRSKEK